MRATISKRPRRILVLAIVALVASLFPAAEPALATPTHYVEMSDGVNIAVNIRMPNGFRKGKTYPTIFEMSGYDRGSADGGDPTGGEG